MIRPEPFSKALSLANCQKACQADLNCTAVTVAQPNGNGPGQVTDDILLDRLTDDRDLHVAAGVCADNLIHAVLGELHDTVAVVLVVVVILVAIICFE